MDSILQGSAKRLRPGLINFAPAVAYHCCLSLPAAFTQPGRSLFADSFSRSWGGSKLGIILLTSFMEGPHQVSDATFECETDRAD